METPRLSRPAPRRLRHRPNLQPIITRLTYTLAPLHALPNGAPHEQFPATILAYHLLTEVQLNSLAKFYHQWTTSPCIWTTGYPACMDWDDEFLEHIGVIWGSEARIQAKRRKFGRFIGLQGCQTPVEEIDELERFSRRRRATAMKSYGDFFGGRNGFGRC